MTTILGSARFYFWPIIAANVLAMTAGAGGDAGRMAWVALVVAVLASFGFLVNDLSDRRIDLVNDAHHFERAPARTIAAGWATALVLAGAGLGIAWALGPLPFTLAAVSTVGLAAYSPVLRRRILVANVATATFASAPLWMPVVLAPSGGRAWQWWLIAGVALMLIAREILMDVRDRAGDRAGGRETLATRVGPAASVRVSARLTLAAVVPFALAIVFGLTGGSLGAGVAAVLVGAVVLVLMVGSTLAIPADAADSTPAIQRYVRRSRLAMALLPLLCVALARPW